MNLGNDTNDGSETNPFKTIQRATQEVKAGDTVLVQPGIYRERVSPIVTGTVDKPITFKSVIKHQAIIRGSVPWIPSNNVSGIASGPIDDSIFTDDSHIDGANPFLIKSCVTPYKREGAPEVKENKNSDPNMIYTLGQVFVNDEMYKQCPYYSEMETTFQSWFYDSSINQLYINGPCQDKTIEITNQRRLFAPHKRGLRYINIDGFILEHCGNQYPNQFWCVRENQQAGLIGTRSGRYWKIENNIIRFANGVGIDWGNEGGANQDLEIGQGTGQSYWSIGHFINNNIISDNGAAGTAAYMAKKFIFSGNIVERNNNLHFYGKRRWESAGLKIHCPNDSTIINNIIRDNYCHGIWSDQGAGTNSLFQNNVILNNEGNGINFEIGQLTTGKVVNNIFDGNDCGVTYVTSGGVLIAHNLFIKSRTCDIQTVIFNRTADKWDSLNVEVFYNLFFHSPQFIQITAPNINVSSRFFNYNVYSSESKFQLIVDSKTKPVLEYKSWMNAMSKYNSEFCDENSICITTKNQAKIVYNEEGQVYLVTIEIVDQIPKFPITVKMGSITDYFGNVWMNTCENTCENICENSCMAGPFSILQYGMNEYILRL